jgi:hypothetical protein
LVDAAQYYEQESPGLGTLFLDAAERCEQAILEYPNAGTVLQGEIRRRLFPTFPFAYLYRVVEGRVRILAVMNLKRRPTYWVGRE